MNTKSSSSLTNILIGVDEINVKIKENIMKLYKVSIFRFSLNSKYLECEIHI